MRVKRAAVLSSKGRADDEPMAGPSTDSSPTADDEMSSVTWSCSSGAGAFDTVVMRSAGSGGHGSDLAAMPLHHPVMPSTTNRTAGRKIAQPATPLVTLIPATVMVRDYSVEGCISSSLFTSHHHLPIFVVFVYVDCRASSSRLLPSQHYLQVRLRACRCHFSRAWRCYLYSRALERRLGGAQVGSCNERNARSC